MNNFFRNTKRLRCLVLIFFLLASLSFAFWGFDSGVSPPALSHESGFYADSFLLELTADDNTTIYYTLDGSVPDQNSLQYVGPIEIRNASSNPNLHSARTDVSTGFRSDLIARYDTIDPDPQYRVPDFPVDKCTVIRAIAISPLGIKSTVSNASFFVGISPETYDGCNILSVITDPDNLFDYENGIYVTGAIFDDYIQGTTRNRNWRLWHANYTQRGSQWEREAVFHLFDWDGTLVIGKDGGIRTHGGVSRGTLPRSLNLYAKKKYDGTSTFGVNLFGGTYDPQTATLSSGGNQIITQFNDYMMTQRVRQLNMATMLFEPYVLFLDGEYWGFYWLTEKYDENYFSHYYGADSGNIVMIKDGSLEIGRSGDLSLYHKMLSFLQENDLSQAAAYQEACTMIDVESCIDYYATMIYIARSEDWPGHNTALWRTRNVTGSTYSDGKWRWILYDCNSTSMTETMGLTQHDTLSYVLSMDPMFASLWENSDFRNQFQSRILEIADSCFDTEAMDAFIDHYQNTMVSALSKSWRRFYGSENPKLTEFLTEMEGYRYFFQNRRSVVESWFSTFSPAV